MMRGPQEETTGLRPASAEPLTSEESALLRKHRRWLTQLASGEKSPVTPAQEHFVRVTRGLAEPDTPYERAWLKAQGRCDEAAPVDDRATAERLEQLLLTRKYRDDVAARKEAERQEVLRQVQTELEAI